MPVSLIFYRKTQHTGRTSFTTVEVLVIEVIYLCDKQKQYKFIFRFRNFILGFYSFLSWRVMTSKNNRTLTPKVQPNHVRKKQTYVIFRRQPNSSKVPINNIIFYRLLKHNIVNKDAQGWTRPVLITYPGSVARATTSSIMLLIILKYQQLLRIGSDEGRGKLKNETPQGHGVEIYYVDGRSGFCVTVFTSKVTTPTSTDGE